MTTPNSDHTTKPSTTADPAETRQHRRRLADQIANQILTARLLGGRVHLVQRHPTYLDEAPPLHEICTQAPAIAATGDPDLVRVKYTPSGAVAVIRLHGPNWSLIMSGGRPLPDWLLAVHDDNPLHQLPPEEAQPGCLHALDLSADPASAAELTRMCQRIHAAISR